MEIYVGMANQYFKTHRGLELGLVLWLGLIYETRQFHGYDGIQETSNLVPRLFTWH